MLLYSASLCVSSDLQGERENHEAESKPLLSYPTPSVQTASESLAILLQHTFVLPNKSGMVKENISPLLFPFSRRAVPLFLFCLTQN